MYVCMYMCVLVVILMHIKHSYFNNINISKQQNNSNINISVFWNFIYI